MKAISSPRATLQCLPPPSSLACVCLQLQYLVETPAGSDDPKRHFKYPFAACEIFCCEVEGIFNTLLENESLLDQLFSILQVTNGLTSRGVNFEVCGLFCLGLCLKG